MTILPIFIDNQYYAYFEKRSLLCPLRLTYFEWLNLPESWQVVHISSHSMTNIISFVWWKRNIFGNLTEKNEQKANENIYFASKTFYSLKFNSLIGSKTPTLITWFSALFSLVTTAVVMPPCWKSDSRLKAGNPSWQRIQNLARKTEILVDGMHSPCKEPQGIARNRKEPQGPARNFRFPCKILYSSKKANEALQFLTRNCKELQDLVFFFN